MAREISPFPTEEERTGDGRHRRYWLQVDQGTKQSFDSFEDALESGRKLKGSSRRFQVQIFDAETGRTTPIGE